MALKIITFYLFIVSLYVCSGGIHAIIVCAVVYMLLCVCVCVRGGIHAIIFTQGSQSTILQEVGCLLLLGVVVGAFTP